MLKKLLLSISLLTFSLSVSAQFEAKINPFAILWGNADVSAEYVISENFGVDFAPTLSFSGAEITDGSGTTSYDGLRYGVVLNPRYYFGPDKGGDKFYFGGYLKYMTGKYTEDGTDVVAWESTRFAGGFNFGYKVVSESGFLFDIGFGIGKAFYNESISGSVADLTDLEIFNIDAIGKLAVGWRF